MICKRINKRQDVVASKTLNLLLADDDQIVLCPAFEPKVLLVKF